MSYMSEYNKLKKKRLEEETKSSSKVTNSSGSAYMDEYNKLRGQGSGVAPVLPASVNAFVQKHKKEERKWYEKGHFEDGYDFGDVTKTILGVGKNKDTVSLTPAEKLKHLYSVYGKEDFGTKSGYVSTKADGFWDKLGSKYGMGYNDLQYEYINNQNGIRDEIDTKAISFGSDTGKTTSSYKEKALDYMTDDEVAVYNYYYQAEGKEKAQEFLDALAETLSARKAGKDFSNIQGKTGLEVLSGVVSGAEQFEQGVKNLGNMIVGKDDYIPQTSTQILTGKIREDLADDGDGIKIFGNSLGQVGFDVLSTGTNMLPSVALGAANPMAGAALMGSSAAGNAYQQVLNEGHDKGGARLYATTIGALEGTLQYLLGGIGKLGGTSTAINRAVSGIKNGALRFSLEYGGKIASEAVEEGLQEVLDPLVKNAILGTDESIDWENAAYSAFLGGLMGGTFGSSEVSNNHLSANEQAVLDKVYKDAVAEKEKNGKLTTKEKNKIYDGVVKDMELGRIDTDTIESVLGGASYEGYKSLTEQETSLKEEIEALENTPENQFTVKQRERLTELREQLKGIDTKTAKSNLFSEVDKLTANDTKLRESYNEKTRRGQAFEADLTKYDAKQQETIKKAVESGILNNTNRTHEFVDLVAKISADKGVLFDFTNNQKLKESGFAIDGKQVNGFVTKDGITLNVQSAKSLDTVVGHEITHVLEGTDLYTELQTAVVEYAKSKNDYQGRYDTLTKLYENVEGANIDSELTAELVGDYIFTDTDFINNLSTNHRNVFQKVYDEIKYLYKVATAGSKEARELERVKKLFDEAYRNGGQAQKNTADSGVKYALETDVNGNVFVDVTEDIFDSNNGESVARTIQRVIAEKFNNLIEANGQKFQINKTTNDEFRRSESATKLMEGSPVAYNDKLKTIANADEILTAAKNWIGEEAKHTRKDDIVEFGRGNVMYRVGGNGYVADVLVGIRKNGSAVLYDLVNIYETNIAEAPVTMASNDNSQRRQDASANGSIANVANANALTSTPTATVGTAPNVNIAQNKPVVKSQNSISKDTTGKELSNEQIDFFKDSKVVDENGNLKVVYHGTPNGEFSVFKEGTYFTDNKAYADRYQNPGASSISTGKVAASPKTFEVYLDIKKPFDLNDPEAKRIYVEEYIKGGNALGINPYLSDAEYEKISTIDWTEGEDLRDFLIENEYDYDGLILDEGADGGYGEDVQHRGKSYVIFNPEQAKSVDNTNPTNNPDINLSLSEKDIAPTGKFLGKDIALETAPVAETTDTEVVEADVAPVVEAKVEDYAPGESLEEQLAKADESLESLDSETEALFRDLSEQRISDEEFEARWKDLDKRFTQARQVQERLSAEMTDINNRKYESLDDSDIPPEAEAPYYGEAESIAPVDPFAKRDMFGVGKRSVKAYMHENPEVKPFFQDAARGMLYDLHNGTRGERIFNEQVHYESGYEKGWMGTKRRTTGDIADLLDQWGYTYDQIEAGLNAIIEDNGKENNAASKRIEFMLDNRLRNGYKDVDGRPIPRDEGYINLLKEKQIDDYRRESLDSFMEVADQYAPPIEDVAPVEDIAPLKVEPAIEGEQNVLDEFEQPGQEQAPERLTRAKLHSQIVDRIKSVFTGKGIDFDKVLDDAHRMNALSINDNTPQRVNDKTFGYEAGEALNELTFNKVALNESEGVKWLNERVDAIRNLSKKYKIKPRSKESAAAQMYAEGFWVNEKDEIIAYGDAELAKDFPDVQVQNRIKALASDPTIREFYDNTLSAINESRKRNAYPEIPKLENYYLHFRAMDDTFSRLGIPFNPNDIKAKDLPTDINGTTIDRKPGQPFFTSAMHREGKRTSFDLLGGLERYANSAKNQIYHIDDIQTARALWGYIADRYGQAHGLENLDSMEFEAQAEHIQKVYDGHLSNYARFLNEYANNLAGKTALIDRGVEGLIGRRALQFINTVNTQTGRNQIGYSISSPLTNFIPSMEAIARTSKRDSIKAFAQTVSNVFRKDGFVENDPTLIRRKGADRFTKTLWEKMSDPGYILMGAVDNVTSEFIVRTKYNELTRKGMDSKQAHLKAGEWASRVMGDRSLGQTPLLYNSKFMGLFTKYQLEVRNQLDSAFYDNIQEVKASTKDVENQTARNAKTAAKIASKTLQIAVLNHAFGMAFEKIAGYNPAFDIISTIATLFGWDDDEDDEDTFGDNANQAFKELLGDLPYTSLITDGGRIPAGSAMPIKQLVTGIDKYGNEKARWETALEALPYYILPGGYSQIKKTTQGLGMFSEEHPVSGSYTDSGNLRFPAEKTFGNVLQAGLFGQYASENARDYFDNERSPLKEKQIQEYIDVDIPIKDYWEYREGLAKLKTNEEKVDYIDSLDLPLSKKNILVNNVLDRKEQVDLENYGEYGSLAEFDYAVKYPEKYKFLEDNGVTFEEYSNFDDDAKDAYNWAYQNPDKYAVSKAISDDVVEYKSYTKGLSKIEADKDEDGKSISGSKKEKVFAYIENLPLDYGQKCILFKSQYKADDSVNMDIIEYLDSREDISYEEMVTILTELDFKVNGNNVYWD